MTNKEVSMKYFMTLLLLTISIQTTFAYERDSQFCPQGAKDPKCWEVVRGNRNRPWQCASETFCVEIISITERYQDALYCEGTDGSIFQCTNLYRTYGERIIGEQYTVVQEKIDGCHVPGACGPKACVTRKSYATASLCNN